MPESTTKYDLGTLDLNKPNAARMYDYYLGGSHNFEADRKAADQVLQLTPWLPKTARLQRAALQDIAHDLSTVRGYDVIIDFASGLPTQDHIHTVAKPGTTVIYSDNDPIVVEFARGIIKDSPNTYIIQGDAREPKVLLENPRVQELLHGKRDVAFILWGLALFLEDDALHHIMTELYDWAGPRSTIAFNAQGANTSKDDPAVVRSAAIYEKMGVKLSFRTLEHYRELIQPWHPDAGGFISMTQWHGLDTSMLSPEELKIVSTTGGGYGAYLIK